MTDPVHKYILTLADATLNTVVTSGNNVLSLDQGVDRLREYMRRSRMTFIAGNGGSLAAAAHMATDFNLAGLRTTALTDIVAATSHANDFGVEAIFTKQLEWLASPKDVLILMSCSGNSPNIIDAALYGQANSLIVVSLTGFDPGKNKLRPLADLDFFVPAKEYGFVQLAHETILHAACDLEAGHVS
jgi:D-sedoheptulose 7-phosphate isomerase